MERLAGCRAPHVDAALGLIVSKRSAGQVVDNFQYRFYATLIAACSSRACGRARRSGARGLEANPVGNGRIDKIVQGLAVLVVDDNQYMRKVVRNILVNLGV